MLQVLLSNNRYAFIDDEDANLVNQFKWSYTPNGYAIRVSQTDNIRSFTSMHRFIMGAKSGEVVDHINGDKLDNRRTNLRVGTYSINNQNRPVLRNNTTGYRGVDLKSGRTKPYRARIGCSGKVHTLGYFSSALEAATAYNEKAMELFGPNARLNVI